MTKTRLVLHTVDLSPFGQRAKIAISAKGLWDQVELVQTPPGADALVEMTPTQRIPVLEVGGEHLPESTIIAEFLNEWVPDPPLLPAPPADRARCRLIVHLLDLYLTKPFLDLIVGMRPPPRPDDMAEAWRATLQGLGYVERYLDAGHYACGETLSLADAALTPLLTHIKRLSDWHGFEGLGGLPICDGYLERIKSDRSASRAIDEIESAFDERAESVKT